MLLYRQILLWNYKRVDEDGEEGLVEEEESFGAAAYYDTTNQQKESGDGNHENDEAT